MGLTARLGFSGLRGGLGATPAGRAGFFFSADAETGFVLAGSWTARGAGVLGGAVLTGAAVEEATFGRAGAGLCTSGGFGLEAGGGLRTEAGFSIGAFFRSTGEGSGFGTNGGAGSADETVVTGPGAVEGGGSAMVGVGSVGVGGSTARAWVQAKPATTTQASSAHGRSPTAKLHVRSRRFATTASVLCPSSGVVKTLGQVVMSRGPGRRFGPRRFGPCDRAKERTAIPGESSAAVRGSL
jgi:hypothetical protein